MQISSLEKKKICQFWSKICWTRKEAATSRRAWALQLFSGTTTYSWRPSLIFSTCVAPVVPGVLVLLYGDLQEAHCWFIKLRKVTGLVATPLLLTGSSIPLSLQFCPLLSILKFGTSTSRTTSEIRKRRHYNLFWSWALSLRTVLQAKNLSELYILLGTASLLVVWFLPFYQTPINSGRHSPLALTTCVCRPLRLWHWPFSPTWSQNSFSR